MKHESSSPLLILVGIVMISAVAALFFLLTTGGTAEAPRVSIQSPEVGTHRELSSAAELTQLAPGGETEEATPPRIALEEESPEPEPTPLIAEEDVVWIEGTVELAPGTPTDEVVRVLSVSRQRSLPQLYGQRGAAEAAWGNFDGATTLLDSVLADEAGRFRIKASRAVGVAHLALSGRYSYSRGTSEVELDAVKEQVALGAELGAWLTGTVSLPAGATAAGGVVGLGPDVTAQFNTLELARVAFSKEVTLGESGTFEFRSLPIGVTVGMLLKHDVSAAQLRLGIDVEPGQHLVEDFTLTRGASVAGRVVDERGGPLPGVEVIARIPGPIGDGAGALREGKTDEDGRFQLQGVICGRVELRCHPEGRRGTKLKLPSALSEGESVQGVELVVDAGEVVAGVVRFSDGLPAEGALVSVGPDLSGVDAAQMGGGIDFTDRGSAETDELGAFEVTGLGKGGFQVTVTLELEEGEHAGDWRAVQSRVSGGTTDLLLELEGLSGLSGRVVDLAGEPLDSFSVSATLEGTGAVFGIGAEEVSGSFKETESGSFELKGLRPGTWKVVARAEAFASSEAQELVLPLSTDAEPLLFALAPAASCTGRVFDPLGQPISGARVTLETTIGDRVKVARGGGPPETYSDPEGKFRLEGLQPGASELVAYLEGYASSAAAPVQLTSGVLTEGVELVLRVGGVLTGEVLKEGEPAAGMSVIVQLMPSYTRQHMMSSDARGEFRIEHLEPGQWQVIAMPNVMTGETDASAGGGMGEMLGNMKMTVAEMLDGEATHVVLGKPPEDPVKLTGVVVHAGEPVEGAVVSMMPEGSAGLSDLKMAVTSEEGAFEVELEKRGEYLFTVQQNVGTGRQNSIEFGERVPAEGPEHSVRFELPLGRISGRIKGPDGSPAAGCRVTLNVEGGVAYGSVLGGHYAELSTDAEGNYDIPCLRPGVYTVSAGGALLGGMLGDDGATSGRSIRSGLRVGEGEWLSGVDFKLERPGLLVGIIQDAAGQPVAGASVWVRDAAGNVLERFALVETDGTGRFHYRGLGPGTYTIFAKKGGEVSPPSAPVRLAQGGQAEATAILGEGTTLVVTVVDKSEAEVRARISVTDEDGHELSGLYSLREIMSQFGAGFTSQEQRVGPLPPGKYRVTASLDDGREAYKNVNLSGQDERKVKLRLK
jgi:protocatechuate 3,4-dioxygenase beta subunit